MARSLIPITARAAQPKYKGHIGTAESWLNKNYPNKRLLTAAIVHNAAVKHGVNPQELRRKFGV